MTKKILITVTGSTNIDSFNVSNRVGRLASSEKHPCTVIINKGVLKAAFLRADYTYHRRNLSPLVVKALETLFDKAAADIRKASFAQKIETPELSGVEIRLVDNSRVMMATRHTIAEQHWPTAE